MDLVIDLLGLPFSYLIPCLDKNFSPGVGLDGKGMDHFHLYLYVVSRHCLSFLS